jgi:predicted metal-dependent enzyme (double-stranded beta helix superfamily)
MDVILRSFINRLESLLDKPSIDTLKKCVAETDGRQLPIEEYISFLNEGYKRNVIHVSSKCEVAVLCFKKGQITPIHDHGGSIGITIIRQGTMTEELFNKQPTGMIVPTFTRRFHMGELSYVNLTTIHRVSNAHTGGLVTINIYFPPLTLMNFYNLENTSVEKWVADYSSAKGS